MKKTVLIFVLMAVVGVAWAVNPVDSIRRGMSSLRGYELLQAHNSLCNLAYFQNDSVQELKFLDDYIKEARRQNNIGEEAYARHGVLICYYNYNMNAELAENLPVQLAFFEKHELWSRYYGCWSLLVDAYIYQNKYRTALREAQLMYADARKRGNVKGLGIVSYCLGDVYHHMQNSGEAIKAYEKAIRLLSDGDDHTILMDTYENYSEVLIAENKFKDLRDTGIAWLLKLEAVKKVYVKKGYDLADLDSKYRYYYLAMARAEMESGNLDYAGELLSKAEALSTSDVPIARLVLLRDYARYYELRKDFEKALACNNERIQLNISKENVRGLLDAKEQRAELLMSSGDYAKAAHLYREFLPVRDSLMSAGTAEQLNELNTLYKVDELTLEKKLANNRLFFALLCALLLLFILIIYIIYTRRLRLKNRVLFDTIVQSEKAQTLLWDKMTQKPESQLESDEILFRQLCKLMTQEQLFKDTDLKREVLASRLNTNRTYLADAVKKYADGVTVLEFINSYRLRYAAGLLTNNPSLPVSDVEYESGFNSRSTFSRLFRDFYGMSPSEYRAISREKQVN